MSWIRNAIAASALALTAGCGTVVFEGDNINGAKVRLIQISDTYYTMCVIEAKGCKYELEIGKGQVYHSKRNCGTIAVDNIKKPQAVYDEYMELIKEPIKK